MDERTIDQLLADVADAAETSRHEPKPRVSSKRAPKDPSQVYAIRIPTSALGDIRRLASDRGVAPTTMLRGWVLDRLQHELGKRPAAPAPQPTTHRAHVAMTRVSTGPTNVVDTTLFGKRAIAVSPNDLTPAIDRWRLVGTGGS